MHKQKFSPQQIKKYIEKIKRQKILVLGDLMLDQFIYGKVNRISPEDPVPVVHVTRELAFPGGAANVARNLSDFGVHTTVSGIVGADDFGKSLITLLHSSKISTEGVIISSEYQTIQKTRIIARQQQVVRVDREVIRAVSEVEFSQLNSKLENLIAESDAVIVEDYGKGFITQDVFATVLGFAQKHRIIVAVDPNPNNPLDWSGATLAKPNRQEAYAAAAKPFAEDEESLIPLGKILLEKWGIAYLLITLGEEGMILFQKDAEPYRTPTRAKEVYDVSGAGDTAIAFFTAALSAGLTGPDAAEIANHAAGVVVGKLGTATLSPEELAESLKNHE